MFFSTNLEAAAEQAACGADRWGPSSPAWVATRNGLCAFCLRQMPVLSKTERLAFWSFVASWNTPINRQTACFPCHKECIVAWNVAAYCKAAVKIKNADELLRKAEAFCRAYPGTLLFNIEHTSCSSVDRVDAENTLSDDQKRELIGYLSPSGAWVMRLDTSSKHDQVFRGAVATDTQEQQPTQGRLSRLFRRLCCCCGK